MLKQSVTGTDYTLQCLTQLINYSKVCPHSVPLPAAASRSASALAPVRQRETMRDRETRTRHRGRVHAPKKSIVERVDRSRQREGLALPFVMTDACIACALIIT